MAEAGVPLYRRLADEIAGAIEAGDLAPGAALSPERVMAESHGVSRVTVRRAMEDLSARGLVEQRRGAGTFVAPRMRQPLSVLTSFTEDVAARGMSATSRVLSAGPGRADPEEVIGLGLSPGAPVMRLSRLRFVDGAPIALESAAVIVEALPEAEGLKGSLYGAMEANGLRPVRAVQRLRAVAAEPRPAALLEIAPGAPALLITRIGYTADGRGVEFTRSTFRGDRWDFVTELA